MFRQILAISLISMTSAVAAELPVELKDAPGRELAANTCSACHSLDYIRMNTPFLTADQWQAEVTKMRKAYGAPIDDADAQAIVQYLQLAYAAKP